jgi:hypothetical protein
MAQISVRPNRVKFIKAVTTALKKIEDAADKYEADVAKYKADYKAWAESADLSPSNIKESKVHVSRTYNCKNDESKFAPDSVHVVLKKYPANMPKEPTPPITGTKSSCAYTEAVKELKSVITLLEMVDDELVNASVANNVKQYL